MFNIFKKKEALLTRPVDLSVLKTDIHSHLIFGVDDGSKSLEESVSLLKDLEGFGYKKLITTPHVFYNSFPEGIEILEQKRAIIEQEMRKQSIGLDLEVSAEYFLDDDISDRIERKQVIPINKNYLLCEFSMMIEPRNYKEWLFNLELLNYNIILAHPERYLYFYTNEGKKTSKYDKKKIGYKFEQLKDRGILFQLNMISLSGYYGQEVKKLAHFLIDNNYIDIIGSDCHGTRHIEAMRKTLYEPKLQELIDSGRLINDRF